MINGVKVEIYKCQGSLKIMSLQLSAYERLKESNVVERFDKLIQIEGQVIKWLNRATGIFDVLYQLT